MTVMDTIRGLGAWLMDEEPGKTLSVESEARSIFGRSPTRPWRIPSVADALGVPSIQRAVSLIASTTGMLTMQGYRNRGLMDDAPAVVARPDPFHTASAFYSGTAAQMGKYGEFVWWIASHDSDGKAAALLLVPLHELTVEENRANRLFPRYRWGDIEGTRYSPANPLGRFVHYLYPLADPFDLRGRGPLQLCGAAASVAFEAQEWAANFYAEGGYPSVNLHDPADLTDQEATDLRNQWVKTPPNTPQVTSGGIELREVPGNEQGAQMLNARQANNGDAARMFGMPGSLLEYQQPGSSLTYQNLEGEFTKFLRVCLKPLYLEPIENAMSDLLPRSTTARFNTDRFMRADMLTRFRVHKLAIDGGIYDADYVQRYEGISPGDSEFAAAPPAPPSAVPSRLPRTASLSMEELRCQCGKLVGRVAGPAELKCGRCGKMVTKEIA